MRTTNRLGCLTGTGIIAALATAFIIAGYAYARGGLMYNPGPLNAQSGEMLGGVTSHAEIGGDCEACHTAPWDSAVMADRCTDCHTAIAAQMREVASLHGTMLHKSPDLGCRHCHPDHRGADAALTEMNDETFPHDAMGFSLNGHPLTAAREPFACHDCHGDDVSKFDLNTCGNCHRQTDVAFMTAHALSFGTACLDCHDGVDRFGEGFDHNVYSFKIKGKHVGLSCDKCHFTARGYADFAVTLQDCYSCHQKDEPHEGRYGTSCADCHTDDGWLPATFDHNLSAFKLDGAHTSVRCEECHSNGQYKGLSTACVSCHAEPDEHAGQFGTDCAACHTTTAWEPASFNGEHSFPLEHGGGASCATCHPSGFTTYTCYGCHEHNEGEVRSEHLEEGIGNFENCMECHPTGQEHEGERGEGGGDDD